MTPWPWPAPPEDGAADHITEGLRLPDVALTATDGTAVSLSQEAGRVVVVIYPWTGGPGLDNPPGWDDIPGAHGSTPELDGFSRLSHGFASVGVRVFGLSGQTPDEQRAFAERQRLAFPLLSDQHGGFRDALKLPTFETGGRVFLKRLTLVLRDGAVERVYYPVHPPSSHAREVMYLCGATRPNAHLGR